MARRDYDKTIFANRLRALREIGVLNSEIETQLRGLLAQVSSLLSSISDKDNPIDRRVWNSRAVQNQFDAIFLNFNRTYQTNLISSLTDLVNKNVFNGDKATLQLLTDAGFSQDAAGNWIRGSQNIGKVGRSIAAVSPQILQSILVDPTGGVLLSDRIWRNTLSVKRSVTRIINQSIINGVSAIDVAKELRPFVLSPLNQAQRTDLRRLRGQMRGLGSSLKASSQRLARSEIGRAYFETEKLRAEKSPVVKAQKWNLSATHGGRVGFDICDTLADTDAYGLGAGVYPTGTVPSTPHPNDLCFLTDVLRPSTEWGQPKEDFKRIIDLRSFKPKTPALGTKFTVRTPPGLGSTRPRTSTLTENALERIDDQFRELII